MVDIAQKLGERRGIFAIAADFSFNADGHLVAWQHGDKYTTELLLSSAYKSQPPSSIPNKGNGPELISCVFRYKNL